MGGVALAGLSTAVFRPVLFEWALGPWVMWRVDRGVALTFDDGPSPEETPRILDALGHHGVRATFFVTVGRALRWPGVVRRAKAEGHAIACHGMTHTPLAFRSGAVLQREVGDALRALEDLLGEPVALFRPPYGARCPRLYRVLRREGVRPVFWTMMVFDWRRPPAQVIASRVVRARSGCIVLLHDGGGDRRPTVESVPLAVRLLRERGEEFVILSGSPSEVALPRLGGGEGEFAPVVAQEGREGKQ